MSCSILFGEEKKRENAWMISMLRQPWQELGYQGEGRGRRRGMGRGEGGEGEGQGDVRRNMDADASVCTICDK